DRVVAGQSAEDLLDQGAVSSAPRTTQAVQRKEGKDDAKLLEHPESLKGTDVEIPALEGALLATRKEAVKLGLLSQASFDSGLALSQAMTQLQPAVAAKGAVEEGATGQGRGRCAAALCRPAKRDGRRQELQDRAVDGREHRRHLG